MYVTRVDVVSMAMGSECVEGTQLDSTSVTKKRTKESSAVSSRGIEKR